jgi:hypothetical protein
MKQIYRWGGPPCPPSLRKFVATAGEYDIRDPFANGNKLAFDPEEKR